MIPQSENIRKNGHIESPAFDDALMAPAADFDDLEALRQEAVEFGIDLSAVRIQDTLAARRAKAESLRAQNNTFAPPAWFQGLLSLVQNTGNALLLLLMLVLAYVALPVSIIGLAVAEVQRVELGVALFDAPRARLMSVVAVSSYLVLLVVQAGMHHNAPQQVRPVWSVRLWWQDVRYTLGLVRRWQPQTHTESQMLGTAISRLGWLIILLGTAGSLETELSQAPGSWYRALWSIMADSSLIAMLAMVGGVSLTAGLLAGLHFSVQLAYEQWIKLVPEGGADFLSDARGGLSSADQAEALYLRSLIEKARQKQQGQQKRPTRQSHQSQ